MFNDYFIGFSVLEKFLYHGMINKLKVNGKQKICIKIKPGSFWEFRLAYSVATLFKLINRHN